MRELFIQATYLAASIFFILGLRSLTRAEAARRGMQMAAVGMVLAIIGTLVHHEILRYDVITAGLVLGAIIGWPLGMKVPMTAMPQQIAISHVLGAIAATLVGIAEYYTHLQQTGTVETATMAALGLEVVLGGLTVSGSFMAFGKLQEIITGRPVTYRGQNAVNLAVLAGALGILIYLIINPAHPALFYTMVGLAFLFGFFLVLPIGGADIRGHRVRHRQQCAHHRRCAGRRRRVHSFDRDEQGDEPVLRERAVRRLRQPGRRRREQDRRRAQGQCHQRGRRRAPVGLRALGDRDPRLRHGGRAGAAPGAGAGRIDREAGR
jgi:hypothetical protein